VQLQWVRPAHQDRSQRTREQILDAAEELLKGGRTFDSLTVAEISREAGSSVGAFYGRFESKAHLMRALYARYASDSDATMAGFSPDGVPLGDVVDLVVAFLVGDYRTRLGLRRAFALAVASDDEVHRMADALTTATVAVFERLLESRRSEWRGDDPHLAAEMVHRLLFGVLESDLYIGQPLTDDVFARELAAAVRAYLGVKP